MTTTNKSFLITLLIDDDIVYRGEWVEGIEGFKPDLRAVLEVNFLQWFQEQITEVQFLRSVASRKEGYRLKD